MKSRPQAQRRFQADARDAKVQSSDLFCERLITGDGKRFVERADEKLTAFIELETAIRAAK